MPRATEPLPVSSPDTDSHPVIPDPTVPDSTPNPAIADPAIADPTVSVQTTVSNQTVQPGVAPPSWIRASTSSHLSGVTEWSFNESQSDIQGRTGSNACVFIALYMGKLCFENNLAWPSGNLLPESWKTSLREAMITGNQIHDDLFDHEGINVTVDDAVAMAGEECGVQRLGPQVDIFGFNPVNQLANLLIREAQNLSRSFSVIVSHERAFLVIVNSDQSAVIVDSHCHLTKGAIIACCQTGNIHSLALWMDAMMNATWQCSLTIASISKVFY